MYTALIVSAGSGKRMKLSYNKVFHQIKGKRMIEYSVEAFQKDEDCERIIIVVAENDLDKMKEIFADRVDYVLGGDIRQRSVINGLENVKSEFVFIHDGARPNIKTANLEALKRTVREKNAAILCHKTNDSVLISKDDKIDHYLNRELVCFVETPQAFKTDLIRNAHESAMANNNIYLDDAGVYMNELKLEVGLVFGDRTNIKATTKTDLSILEELL